MNARTSKIGTFIAPRALSDEGGVEPAKATITLSPDISSGYLDMYCARASGAVKTVVLHQLFVPPSKASL